MNISGRKLTRRGLIVAVVVMLAIVSVPVLLAASGSFTSGIEVTNPSCTPGDFAGFQTTATWDANPAYFTGVISNPDKGTSTSFNNPLPGPYSGLLTGAYFVPAFTEDGDTLVYTWTMLDSNNSTVLDVASIAFNCATGALVNLNPGGEPPPPTAIWLADVCEPLDGFSGDGWTTVGSNAASLPWGTTLYVAAGPDGPWTETGFLQPPYVISEAQMDALVALVGAADRDGVWMRAGTNGIAAMYGSMVQDREWHMDALCGTE